MNIGKGRCYKRPELKSDKFISKSMKPSLCRVAVSAFICTKGAPQDLRRAPFLFWAPFYTLVQVVPSLVSLISTPMDLS